MEETEEEARDRRKTRHIDVPLGKALRLERDARGLSREWLADRLDVSNSTIQRYEEGRTRIPAARLWQLCNLLGVPLTELFSTLPHNVVRHDGGVVREEQAPFVRDDGRNRRTAALARAAARLSDDRLAVAEILVKALRSKPGG